MLLDQVRNRFGALRAVSTIWYVASIALALFLFLADEGCHVREKWLAVGITLVPLTTSSWLVFGMFRRNGLSRESNIVVFWGISILTWLGVIVIVASTSLRGCSTPV